ncbi:hypothetical protein DUNSADRAFT_2491 [Dunaliella salina]|uniref:Encoded protein n=1 Tax=Dunaliella salina TaxID=3046 RepID=A0ABQ7FW94_DUNSA|nr:hypothetical protein DUNSADRAFT_2491 [Dunaliella salina]|eukprot:KAF5826633.1 hypothetical protein DUNSADRAFT_2491 [Dunaliella salina]
MNLLTGSLIRKMCLYVRNAKLPGCRNGGNLHDLKLIRYLHDGSKKRKRLPVNANVSEFSGKFSALYDLFVKTFKNLASCFPSLQFHLLVIGPNLS